MAVALVVKKPMMTWMTSCKELDLCSSVITNFDVRGCQGSTKAAQRQFARKTQWFFLLYDPIAKFLLSCLFSIKIEIKAEMWKRIINIYFSQSNKYLERKLMLSRPKLFTILKPVENSSEKSESPITGGFVGSTTVTETELLIGSRWGWGFSARHSYFPASAWVKSAMINFEVELFSRLIISILIPPRWWAMSNFVPFNHHQIWFGGSSWTTHSRFNWPPKVTRVFGGDRICALELSAGFFEFEVRYLSSSCRDAFEACADLKMKVQGLIPLLSRSHFCPASRTKEFIFCGRLNI